ncbi:methionine adenosyltransferase [Trichothermofontia sp.]
MRHNGMFSSESVTPGHPDKLCDQISDAIVDRLLQQDRQARVLTECAISKAIVFLSVQFVAKRSVDFTTITRQVIDQVGYDHPPFRGHNCSILSSVEEQSPDQVQNFDEYQLEDAGIDRIPVRNQANLFGFACNQTPILLPLPIWLAHKLARYLDKARQHQLPYLTPDGKTQVGVEYNDHKPYRIHSVTIEVSQNMPDLPSLKQLQSDIQEGVIQSAFADEPLQPDAKTHIFINPNGPVITGGPLIHAGLTGRKNGIDTYGEYSKHSSAALSGKDPLRIDRIGAYAARYAAKNVVAAGLAEECEVHLSYSIGQAGPVSIEVETFGTGKVPEEKIIRRLSHHFDFRLAGIIKQFDLRGLPARHPDGFFRKLATFGQVGRIDLDLPWEKTDKVAYLTD